MKIIKNIIVFVVVVFLNEFIPHNSDIFLHNSDKKSPHCKKKKHNCEHKKSQLHNFSQLYVFIQWRKQDSIFFFILKKFPFFVK